MPAARSRTTVRIGGASGFWGDSSVGAPQLVASGGLDFLVFDYLAETTMAIMAAARARRPELGYATDFVDIAMRSVLPDVLRQGIRVVSNAGGIHPQGCAAALRRLAAELGVAPRIAVVEGDDLLLRLDELRRTGVRTMPHAAPLPERVLSANAYLGAWPIARALNEGADIVVTGRCVDSAVTLGALIHAFGWTAGDLDRLAAGSLAGHIAECGCQATGGLFTDWDTVPDWAGIGYPVLECAADGGFVVTKPKGSGGLVRRAAVAEQLLYEIGDPGAYVLPDVTCDFRAVRIEQLDDEHVRVSGARGRPGPASYKVSATWQDGFRCVGWLAIVGIDAVAKARRTGEAIVERTRQLLREAGFGDYTATRIEVVGAETLYGPRSTADAREVMLRLVCDHPQAEALKIMAREIAAAGTSWAPGTGTPGLGRPSPSPLVRPFAFAVPRNEVQAVVTLDGRVLDGNVSGKAGGESAGDASGAAGVADAAGAVATSAAAAALPEVPAPWRDPPGPMVEVPLIRLAWGRSGDKGDISNIGLIARRAEWMPLLWDRLTPEVVQAWFAHLVRGRVERFYLPGLPAMNLVLHEALDGGGPGSPRLDPLGKGMAQMLLEMPLRVPAAWMQPGGGSASA